MKMHFKQRLFSWFDSYDVYDEQENILYIIKGQLAWGHCLKIFDGNGNEIGTVKERIFTFLPKFEVYIGEQYIGCISKRFTLFTPKFDIDFKGWNAEGDFFQWDYQIKNQNNEVIATVSKELFHLTDNYTIDVKNNEDNLAALALVLAIDAEKCSRK